MRQVVTIAEVAAEAGLPVERVLQRCWELGVGAVSGRSRLVAAVADRVRRHLGVGGLVRASETNHAVASHAEVLEVVTPQKATELLRRGIGQAELPAVSAVALDASATAERDTEHGECRLRVNKPWAGGSLVVVLARHRYTRRLVIVSCWHDSSLYGHCRCEFRNAAKTVDTFVTPAARLALLS